METTYTDLFDMPAVVAPAAPAAEDSRKRRKLSRNSLAAYANREPELNTRAGAILNVLRRTGPMTDRGILRALFPETDDMNRVRPRVNDLKTSGLVIETGTVVDSTTGERVRIVAARDAGKAVA